jgi:phosphoglycolate phosphatase-like HAD superfamily hydrolase
MKCFLDFDGPLLDNRPKYAAIYRELTRDCDGVPLADDAYWLLKRACMPEAEILERSGVSGEQRQIYLRRRQARLEDYCFLQQDRVWPGVHHWLRTQKADHELFLVTLRKRRETLMKQLVEFELLQYFDAVLNENANDGTAAVKVRLMATYIDSAEPCVLVGDTEADIRAAKASGIMSVALTCGIRNRDLLVAERPDTIFHKLSQVNPAQLAMQTNEAAR